MTIVVPRDLAEGGKGASRRERGVPALPPYLRNEWRREESALGPIVAGVSRRRSNESRSFLSPGRPSQTADAPLARRFFLALRLSQ